MENPFYSALNFNGMGLNSQQAADNAAGVLLPFVHYLDNSINALKDKEVSCHWKPVVSRRFRLICQEKIYQLVPESEIEVILSGAGWYEILCEENGTPLDQDFETDVADPITVGKGKSRRQYMLSEHDVIHERGLYRVYLPDLAAEHSEETVISWVGYRLKLRPVCIDLGDINTIHIDRQQCEVIKISDNRVRFKGIVASHSQLSINGQDLAFNVVSTFDRQRLSDIPFREQGHHYLLFSRDKPQIVEQKVQDVTEQQFKSLLVKHFTLDEKPFDPQTWQLDCKSGELALEMRKQMAFRPEGKVRCETWPELHFSIAKSKQEENWIQLIEKEGTEDSGKSDLDYFFEDRVTILDPSQRRSDGGYRVLKARPEERQLLLALDRKGANRKSVYPTKADGQKGELRVSVDISQLTKQKNALKGLMARPDKDHQALVNLLQPRQQTRWQDFEPVHDVDWQVLTDPTFDGCDRQREFVCKALASPDFAILDGPPGTGKTTTILELIIQLIMSGKRVLLSASTHAAINNVLERIMESDHLQQRIFPLRIGDESNAIEVKQFQFDNQLLQLTDHLGEKIATKQLLVDSSNLVCGTTIGILRLFNEKTLNFDSSTPPFDVMIIDECSKTTFQEFLVPALFAKRWVLVGDERQLSPFTDREQIVANLDNLMLQPKRGKQVAKTLSPDVQQACFLLEELRGSTRCDELYQQPMLMPVSAGVLQALDDEIQARFQAGTHCDGLESLYVIPNASTALGRRSMRGADRSVVETLKREPWRFYTHTLYFVDQNVLDQLNDVIPDDMLIVHPEWQTSAHAFTHRISGKRHKVKFKRNTKYKDKDENTTSSISDDILKRLSTTKWSEELCWRLEREYWLRLSADREEKTDKLSKTVERLVPKSIEAHGRIRILRDIAFPSILEALSGSGLAKRRKDLPTTLNQGFDAHERSPRHATLTYQHRMHPDISAFPREQFYTPDVLKDGGNTSVARAWQYERYAKRNIWFNVKQGAIFRNTNPAEVEAVVKELRAFCDWAVKHPKKIEDGEPEYYDVAVLTFYKGQEKALREAMKKALPGNDNCHARFYYKEVAIKLATVDYFQGQEADLVLLSMVNNSRDGFMDSPNRLNVAITRARYQLVIVGDHEYFSKRSRTHELRNLAHSSHTKRVMGKNSRTKRSQQGR